MKIRRKNHILLIMILTLTMIIYGLNINSREGYCAFSASDVTTVEAGEYAYNYNATTGVSIKITVENGTELRITGYKGSDDTRPILVWYGALPWLDSYMISLNNTTATSTIQNSVTKITFDGYIDGNSTDNLFAFCYNCPNLKEVYFGDNFDASDVTDAHEMFENCSSLTTVHFGAGFNPSGLTGSADWLGLYNMFSGCSALTSVDLSGFTSSALVNCHGMFENCSSLTSVVLGPTSGSDKLCVSDCSSMFSGCSALTSVSLTNLDTSSCTNMSNMFKGCTLLTSSNLSNFSSSSTGASTAYMFYGCSSLTSLTFGSSTNITYSTDCTDMFIGCNALETLDLSNLVTASTGASMSRMFYHCYGLKSITLGNSSVTSYPTSCYHMFSCYPQTGTSYTGDSNLETVVLNNFDTSKCLDMTCMFARCKKLSSLNQDASGNNNIDLDLTLCTNIASIFEMCESLENINLGSNFTGANVTNAGFAFVNCTNLQTISGIKNFVGNSTSINMTSIFNGCTSLTSIDLGKLNSSSACMDCAFKECTAATKIVLGDASGSLNLTGCSNMVNMWNSKSVASELTTLTLNCSTAGSESMENMFYGCGKLKYATYTDESTNTPFSVSNFDTSSVTTMESMFCGCSSLTSLSVSNFDTSIVETMKCMFQNCTSLASLSLSNFNTSECLNMSYMFSTCSALTTLDVSSFDTSKVTAMEYMFFCCYYLTNKDSSTAFNVNNFVTSNVTNMTSMFQSCTYFTSLDLTGFDTSKVTSMYQMFYGCTNMTSFNLSSFSSGEGVTVNTYRMFEICTNLQSVTIGDSTHTLKTNNCEGMFKNCGSLTNLSIANLDTSKSSNMQSMFYFCDSLETLDLTNFNTSQVLDMSYMFYNCTSIENLNLSSFTANSTSGTNIEFMFYYCLNVKTIILGNNTDAGGNITCMNKTFTSCDNVTSITIGKNFKTGQITNMDYLFEYLYNLTEINGLEYFDTSKVTSMQEMFYCCSKLKNINVSNFDTSSVKNMSKMFSSCQAITKLNLSNFDMTNVTNAEQMITYCTSLSELNLSNNTFKSGVSITGYIAYDIALTKIILPANLNGASIELPAITNKKWVGYNSSNERIDYSTYYDNLTESNTTTGLYYISPVEIIDVTTISDLSINGVVDKTYTGSAITQDSITVTGTLDGNTVTFDSSCYDVTYNNNTAIGNETAEVVVTFKGLYTGSITDTFSITNVTLNVDASTLVTSVTKEYDSTNKVYFDTSKTETKTCTATGLDSEEVTFTITGTYTDVNVGENKEVTFTAQTTSSNYTINLTNNVLNIGEITAKEISPSSAKANSKTYDGTVNTTVDITFNSSDILSGEDVNLTYNLSASFENANAGNYKEVTLDSTFTLTGDDASNYKAILPSMTANIYKKSITSDMIPDVSDQTYTGLNITPVTVYDSDLSKTLTVNSDYEITYTNNKNVGEATATITGLNNYTVEGILTKTFNIVAKELIVDLSTKTSDLVVTKVYDKNDTVYFDNEKTQTTKTFTVSGVNSEVVSYTLSGKYSSLNADANIPVTFTKAGNLKVNNIDTSNYTLTLNSNPLSVGTITQKEISITNADAQNKVYDGTKDAVINNVTLNASDIISGDTLTTTYNNIAGTFASKEVGTTITVTANASLTLSGTDAANYIAGSFPTMSANITSNDISKKTITLEYTSKAYNGTELKPQVTIDGLTLETDYTLTYPSDVTNAGEKTITINGIGNYAGTTTTKTYEITKNSPSIDLGSIIGTVTKTYDGNTKALFSGSETYSNTITLANSEVLTLNITGTYDNKNAQTGKTITLSVTPSLNSGSLDNYDINYIPSSLQLSNGIITEKEITIASAEAQNKAYDGANAAEIKVTLDSDDKITGDNLDLEYTIAGTFNDANVGIDKEVTTTNYSSISLSGTDASNYTLNSSFSGTLTANISGKSIDLSKMHAISDQTYTGSAIEPEVTIDGLTEGIDFEVNYSDNINAGINTAFISITGIGACLGSAAGTTFTINPYNLEIDLDDIKSSLNVTKVYDGNTNVYFTGSDTEKEFSIAVASTGETVKYSLTGTYDNKNAGTLKEVTFTLTGDDEDIKVGDTKTSNYNVTLKTSSKVQTTGEITKKDLLINAYAPSKDYDGTDSVTITLSIMSGKVTGDDVSLAKSQIAGQFTQTNAGINIYVNKDETVALQGGDKDNYNPVINNESSLSASIYSLSLTSDKITITASDKEYTGSQVTSDVTVKFNDVTLTEGTDYEILKYTNNTNAGTAKVTIEGKGNFKDQVDKEFTISPKDISTGTITIASGNTYTGSQVKPAVTLNGVGTLTEGTDYEVGYSNNINAGTANVAVNGKGNYTGTITGTFNIERASIFDAVISEIPMQVYINTSVIPDVTITFNGITLSKGSDYTLEYTDNSGAGTGKVTITGKGNFKGDTSKTFTITQTITSDIIKNIPDQIYTGSEIKPDVIIEGLTLGTDYEIAGWDNNTEIGVATVYVNGISPYGGLNVSKTFNIVEKQNNSSDDKDNDNDNKKETATITVSTSSGSDNNKTSYLTGYSSGIFNKKNEIKPNNNITRAELATILTRLDVNFIDTKDYSTNVTKYTDGQTSKWYSNAVGYVTEKGLMKGYENGSFIPNGYITRGELCQVICNYKNINLSVALSYNGNLNDIEDKWYINQVKALYELGYINGYEDNSFKGDKAVTRAEACKIINKMLGINTTNVTKENVYSDLNTSDWYYNDVLAATMN